MSDVHTRHCCAKHGCKYGSSNCSVVNGEKEQEFPCEQCNEEQLEAETWHQHIADLNHEVANLRQQLATCQQDTALAAYQKAIEIAKTCVCLLADEFVTNAIVAALKREIDTPKDEASAMMAERGKKDGD